MTSTASTEYLMYFSGFFVKGKLANLQKKKNQIQPNQHGIRNKVWPVSKPLALVLQDERFFACRKVCDLGQRRPARGSSILRARPLANLSRLVFKSFRGRRNAGPAAPIMKACELVQVTMHFS